MTKKEFNPMSMKDEMVQYGKRYGYWWKQHKKVASKIKDYSPAVDYFSQLEYTLDKPMSNKHLQRWLRI